VRAAVQAAQTSPPFSTPAALPLMGPTTLFGNRYCDCKPERTCAGNIQRDTSHATDSTTPLDTTHGMRHGVRNVRHASAAAAHSASAFTSPPPPHSPGARPNQLRPAPLRPSVNLRCSGPVCSTWRESTSRRAFNDSSPSAPNRRRVAHSGDGARISVRARVRACVGARVLVRVSGGVLKEQGHGFDFDGEVWAVDDVLHGYADQ
jgi:hypothetical protein